MRSLNKIKRKEKENERRIGTYKRKIIIMCIWKHIDKLLYKNVPICFVIVFYMIVNLKEQVS